MNAVLDSQHGLGNQATFHSFCRLLGRLKSNFQLIEMYKTEGYDQFLVSSSKFTILSFKQWRHSQNSMHYILGLWARMVSALPYIKMMKDNSKPNTQLDKYAPLILEV